ncbi:hypothetical protein AA313_de0205247 [Arthrobotrys entomopaga]|nr:hypothetical protein AA313_de0205247 [Arthrobotrys entomopaga]
MKTTLISSLAALVSLQTASAANAPFYTWPNAHSTGRTDKVELLSHAEARLSFASRLGLSQFHSIGVGINVYKLQRVAGAQRRLWTDKDEIEGTILMNMGGVAKVDEFWKESPNFEIEDSPSFDDMSSMVKRLESQAENVIDSDAKTLYSNSDGGFVDVISPRRNTGIDLSPNLNQWSLFESAIGESDASRFKSDDLGDVSFFEEYMVLKSLAEKTVGQVMAEKATLFVQIGSLETIARKEGVNSQKHKVASKLMSNILKDVIRATAAYPSIIGLIPPTAKNAKRGQNLELVGEFDISLVKRKEAPLAPTHSPKLSADDTSAASPLQRDENKIARPKPGCFQSEDTCGNATNSCNGRGKCIKSTTQSNCWSCLCSPTVIKVNGLNKTTHWGGNACQKKDVSVPFLLFTSFAIGLTFALLWTINKMIGMGEEELPGELSAGVAIVRK